MATRADARQAAQETARASAQETARLGISTVVESVATGIITIGAATPVVAPLCVALLKAKGIVDGASRNKEELKELCERCDLITVQVIDKAKASNTSTVDVSPLQECVDKLEVVAKRYHDQGRLARLAQLRRDGEDIQRLRARIEAVVPIMGLAGVVNNGEKLDQILARLQPRPKLAKVPTGLPSGEAWHAVRDEVEDEVYEILSGDEPAVAALTGQSGAGKSTAAAAMVGERQGPIRPRAGETYDQARTRLDRLREHFSHGVVYLRVGKGEGAPKRLPDLMRKLAKALHQDVMKNVDAPGPGEDGESYVKKIVTLKKKRCLVMADDVWEPQVVEKLKETGLWVLLTTRDASIAELNERVVVDQLTPTEAAAVLRGAAELPPGQPLCNAAMEVLDDICGFVAMDIAFVGSWSTVRRISDSGAWEEAVSKIKDKIDDARRDADGMNDSQVKRLAVLRTGFDYLGEEEGTLAQKLYVALAVFPDGHAFGVLDAAVLLNDTYPPAPALHHMKVASRAIDILERWAVLTMDASKKYRMHDAHVDFARDKIRDQGDVRKQVVRRWTSHISRLDFAVSIDVYALLRFWRALEEVGGKGWWVTRPYDDQLVAKDASDSSKVLAVHVVAELYEHDRKYGELEAIMRKVLEHCDVHGGDCPEVEMIALYYTRNALGWLGRFHEREDVARRLGELGGTGLQLTRPVDGAGFLQRSTILGIYGVCARAAGNLNEAEDWFLKAVKSLDGGGLTESYQIVFAMVELGQCEREAGRLGEAEAWFKRVLEIIQAKLGPDDMQVAVTLQQLSQCVREAGRPGEAEGFSKRALDIGEAELGPDDLHVAMTLHEMGLCVREAGRLGEAEGFFKRALEIKEAKLGRDDLSVAGTLREMGVCVRQAGRPGEAEGLFQRVLEIIQANLGPDDLQVAYTLQKLGLCVRQAGRPGEAEGLFQRALEIREAKKGPDDLSVAVTLDEMGVCVRQAGRPGEAEGLFQRALEIKEGKLGRDDLQVAVTLGEMGLCVRQMGRPGEAEGLLKRELEILEAEFGPDDLSITVPLQEMGLCVREAGRPGEAEGLFKRALEIKEAKLGRDDLSVAWTLHEMGLCVREAGRPGEAEWLFKRALEIQEAKLGPDDLQVAMTLGWMGVCVRQAGRPGEAERLLKRSLEIQEAKKGAR